MTLRLAEPIARHSIASDHPVQLATPLLEVHPGLLLKFESDNPGGSHKVRAARFIVRSAIASGDIVPGHTTVIEKTGGNFGFGLALACQAHNVPVELAVGLEFSAVKRRCLELFGARLIGLDMLERGATPREVVEWHLEQANELERHYFYTDQFHNPASVAAHELETGPEIAMQLKAWPEVKKLTFVSCAGTGASLTGIATALKHAGYAVDVVLVEPQGCDSRNGIFTSHKLEGMSVGVVPPFLDWNLINEVRTVSHEEAMETRQTLARTLGFIAGNTAAACLTVAHTLARSASCEHKVLSLMYDHGLWYLR
ncbi:pyridoxal-phosphate dependent enzyme [Paraburkholderia bonniea]|uniref:PLP-dependent cysteine synthase family protein n=1 Tax=Paraburkholderia bonniea TaxID=2152891 RepID=UPI0012917EA5|nr:pyridoxal-phosphate dependent enzyme [Paraburkholderia bonniea]WJF90035.1 pyridoxal-phosphate dependent enzyme [Paraburkholderia bonniea]WJF93349.1 pyridoxal-phosphate dependent enzyme [Paraburkholderia bonniea]